MKLALAVLSLLPSTLARLGLADEGTDHFEEPNRDLQLVGCTCLSDYDCQPTCILDPYTNIGVCGSTGSPPTPAPPAPSPTTTGGQCPCDSPKKIPTICEVGILIELMDIAVSSDLKRAAQWLRAAFHDAGTFNKQIPEGGANGCLMNFPDMLQEPENEFLDIPVFVLNATKTTWENHPSTCIDVSSADIIQFAGLFAAVRQKGPVPGVLDEEKINQLLKFQWGRSDEPSCNTAWTQNLPGFSLGSPANNIPVRCLGAGGEIKTKMMDRNGFTAEEATALIGAHTIGLIRNTFGTTLAGPWVTNGDDNATPNGPVFDNAYHFFLKNTIVENTAPAFAQNVAPFDTIFPDWFRDTPNDLDHLDTDITLAFPSQNLLVHPSFDVHTAKYADDNTFFLSSFFTALDKMSKLGVTDTLFVPTECVPCNNGVGLTAEIVVSFVKLLGSANAEAEDKLDKKQEARADEIASLTTKVTGLIV